MNPLNDVVTQVHGIGAFGHEFDPKRVLEPGGFERLGPPAGAFEERRADRLGSAAIKVVDDWVYRFAECGRRIFLLQTMTSDETLADRLTDGCGVIHVRNAEK